MMLKNFARENGNAAKTSTSPAAASILVSVLV